MTAFHHYEERRKLTPEKKLMPMGLGSNDPNSLMKIFLGGMVGIGGALAMWFNEILNGEAQFSIANFVMLCFIGALIGALAIIVAPVFHVDENYTVVFSCAAAASHKYIFRTCSWFLDKWTKV